MQAVAAPRAAGRSAAVRVEASASRSAFAAVAGARKAASGARAPQRAAFRRSAVVAKAKLGDTLAEFLVEVRGGQGSTVVVSTSLLV